MIIRAVIPAAGEGKRMKANVSKQFLELAGQPILHHTLKAIENSGLVESITLVVPASSVDQIKFDYSDQFPSIAHIIAGGEMRQDSVYKGLCSLGEDTEIVIVHDGVRPFLTSTMIQMVTESAEKYGAAIVATPLNDTLKRINHAGFVQTTVDRVDLWRVQTPQAFQYPLLRSAMEQAREDNFYGTDEGMLIEHFGHSVRIVPGSEQNIKITRSEDLPFAETIAAYLNESK